MSRYNAIAPPDGVPDRDWPGAYAWAIGQTACPAYCCSARGAIVASNRSAQRLWGGHGRARPDGAWDGFEALYDAGGAALPKAMSPAALAAATGQEQPPTEVLAQSADGQRRRLIMHAHPVLDAGGALAGVLCSLTDISERARLQAELHEAIDQRGEFLAILAHELRNPLSPILSVAGTLRRVSSDPHVARLADIVERQTRQLARFIADLLDTSRIERACDIPIVPRGTTVAEVLDLACDVAAPAMHARHQRLAVDTTARATALWCDPERIAQAVGNVLVNASRFSADGAPVALHARTDGTLFEVDVADQGIGIAPMHLRDVFRPFRQLDRPDGRAASGAGLGLAIARTISQVHHGILSVHSEGPGHGTLVRFVLPIVRPAA